MKKIIFIYFLFVTNLMFSQNNFINASQMHINNINLNNTELQIVNSLGLTNPINFYNELTNENYIEYTKNSSKFYFQDNLLVDFILNDNSFFFIHPNLKVGNNIDSLSLIFPLSDGNKSVENNLGFMILNLKLNDGTILDVFIVINYNPQTNIITSIHKGEY